MARLLITGVTVTKNASTITCGLRLRGGQEHPLILPTLKPAWELRRTSQHVIRAIDELLDHHTTAHPCERHKADESPARGAV